jgi:hypothetical protein
MIKFMLVCLAEPTRCQEGFSESLYVLSVDRKVMRMEKSEEVKDEGIRRS